MSDAVHAPAAEGERTVGPRRRLAHQFDDIGQQREAESLGMWAFLATEVLFFGAIFTGYFSYRVTYSADFEAASGKLNILIGAVNTVVLLGSSLTMALAVHAAQTGWQRMLVWCLVGTALLGTLFMVFKAVEYSLDYYDKLVPVLAFDDKEWTNPAPPEAPVNPRHVELFLMFYYILTGLHALHLTVGIGVLVVFIILAARGRFGPEHYSPVEVAGLYWHFIDIVWIFLLPLLYLIGTHHSLL
jgi:cytochrome c oxidase subunit 3